MEKLCIPIVHFLVKISKINKTLQNLITAKDRTKENMNGKGDKFLNKTIYTTLW